MLYKYNMWYVYLDVTFSETFMDKTKWFQPVMKTFR